MTIADLVQGIDEQLVDLRSQIEKLQEARAHLAPTQKQRRVKMTVHDFSEANIEPRPRRPKGEESTRTATRATGTRAKILETLRDTGEPLTAQQVADATGLGRGSVSTTLSKLTKAGQIAKADRGYSVITV